MMIIETTADGSNTLFVPELNEHYHSTFGAVQESRHIFISEGLLRTDKEINPLNIFEMGFGTGLNAFLTLLEAERSSRPINYSCIEKFPVSPDLISQLNYPQCTEGCQREKYISLHDAPWNEEVEISGNFILKKIEGDILNWKFPSESCDLVYFDAFGPEVQPELWSEVIFRKLWVMMKPFSILLTYSAKGSVRRALNTAGFSVEKIPGPPGKREIVRAIKK